jgi:hypothetical protein
MRTIIPQLSFRDLPDPLADVVGHPRRDDQLHPAELAVTVVDE